MLKTTLNLSELPDELTQKLVTGETAIHSWYSSVITNVGHYYVVIMKGL